jgi:hypothetical protein
LIIWINSQPSGPSGFVPALLNDAGLMEEVASGFVHDVADDFDIVK